MMAIAAVVVDDVAAIGRTKVRAVSRAKPVRAVKVTAAKLARSASLAKHAKIAANGVNPVKSGSRANVVHRANRVTKTPVRKAFPAARSRRSYAAATNA